MGFFNDLKEDLAAAVNELTESTAEKELADSEEKLREELAGFDEEKKSKKKKKNSKKNASLEQEIQNILNGIDDANPGEYTGDTLTEEMLDSIDEEVSDADIEPETEISFSEFYNTDEETDTFENEEFENVSDTVIEDEAYSDDVIEDTLDNEEQSDNFEEDENLSDLTEQTQEFIEEEYENVPLEDEVADSLDDGQTDIVTESYDNVTEEVSSDSLTDMPNDTVDTVDNEPHISTEATSTIKNISEDKIVIETPPVTVSIEELQNINSNVQNTKFITKGSNKIMEDQLTVITKGTSIKGDIISDGAIEVYGSVTGSIAAQGKIVVSGEISGDSKGNEIFVDGAKIHGNLDSDGTVKIANESIIIGNIKAACAVIAGAVKGNIDVNGPVVLDSTAKVLGDIDCKLVQINNGAVIEGRCSQSYADVSPSSFFENL